jgi:hypothetical protein
MVGLRGGYTTFSAFSLQTLDLVRLGDCPRAAVYIVASVALCLLGVWLGHIAAAASVRAPALCADAEQPQHALQRSGFHWRRRGRR